MRSRYIVITLIIISFVFIWNLYSIDERETRLLNVGNSLVNRIEKFKTLNHRMPSTLEEISNLTKDNDDLSISFQKNSPNNYMVSFGESLGESRIYFSDSKKWESSYRQMK